MSGRARLRRALAAVASILVCLVVLVPSSPAAAEGSSYQILSPVPGGIVFTPDFYFTVRAHGYAEQPSRPRMVLDGLVYSERLPWDVTEVEGTTDVDMHFYWWTGVDRTDEPSTHTVLIRDLDGRVPDSEPVTFTLDGRVPQVTMTPTQNSVVTGGLQIAVEATGPRPMQRAEFWLGQDRLGEDLTEPFTFTADTTVYPDGGRAIRARVTDIGGVSSEAYAYVFLDNDGESVNMRWDQLDDGDLVGGDKFPLLLYVHDARLPRPISMRPQFLVDGVPTDSITKYMTRNGRQEHDEIEVWHWDTTGLSDGEHVLVARDVSGYAPDTEPVRVVVDNTSTTIEFTSLEPGQFVDEWETVDIDVRSPYQITSAQIGGALLDTEAPWSGLVQFYQPNGPFQVTAEVTDVNGIVTRAEPLPVVLHRAVDTRPVCHWAEEDGFTDVPVQNAHEAAIDCAVHAGLARGRTDTTYEPSASVTRAQMATFIARLIEPYLPEPDPALDVFTDDNGSVHEDNIELLAEFGIVGGYGDGTFGPDRRVTRAQMASFLARAVELAHGVMTGASEPRPLPARADYFVDDDAEAVHGLNINKIAEAGIAIGGAGRTYAPTSPVTRDQMATFLVRALVWVA